MRIHLKGKLFLKHSVYMLSEKIKKARQTQRRMIYSAWCLPFPSPAQKLTEGRKIMPGDSHSSQINTNLPMLWKPTLAVQRFPLHCGRKRVDNVSGQKFKSITLCVFVPNEVLKAIELV